MNKNLVFRLMDMIEILVFLMLDYVFLNDNKDAVIYLFNKGFRPSILPRNIPTLIENQADKHIRKLLYQKPLHEFSL